MKLGSLQPALVLHPTARAYDAAPLHPTEGNEATPEHSLQSNVAHRVGTPAAHAIDEADAHHLPLRVAQEATKYGAEVFKTSNPRTLIPASSLQFALPKSKSPLENHLKR